MVTGPSIAVDGAKSRRRLHLAPHLLLAIAVLPCKVVDAQVHDCPINELSEHLNDIAEHCCPGNDCSATGYPTAADATCSVECGTELEPFWDSCSETLSLLGMLPDGLAQFYDTCMAVLYPPGQCGDTCDQATFHCRTMEIDQACCSDPSNCPEDRATPMSCSVGCSLLYPSFMEDCADILEDTMESEVVSGLQDFSETCAEQDPSSVLEYANALVREGCEIELPQASGDPPRTLPPSAPLLEVGSSWLNELTSGSCNSFEKFLDRLHEAKWACCARGACESGGFPETCTPQCAVVFHSMLADCSFLLSYVLPDELVEPYGQFDQLCQAESTVDVGEFLEAIHEAQCCTPDVCSCPDEDSCNAAREMDDDLESVCVWTEDSGCQDLPCPTSRPVASVSECSVVEGENGGGDDGGQVFTNGRYVYYIGDSGVARTSSTSFTSLDHIRGDVPSDWGKALFADASVGQIYRLCHDCGSAVTGSQVNEGGTATQLQCLDDDLNFQSVVDLSISYTMQNPMVLAVGEGNVAFLDSANHWQLMTLPPGCSAAPEVMDLGVGSGPSEPGSWCESLDRVQVGYLESAIGDNGITFSVLLVGSNDNNKLRRFTLPDGGEEILSFPFCYWSGNTCSLAMDIEKRQFYAHGESQCGLAETVFSCPVEFQQCGNGRRRQLEHALNAEDQDVKTAESFRSVPDTEMSSLGNSSDVTTMRHSNTLPEAAAHKSTHFRQLQIDYVSTCNLADLGDHLIDIAEHCCPGNDCSATGYPTADATCSVECGTELEPFWDSCSQVLHAVGLIPFGMPEFYDTCMAVLYPPGRCGDACNDADSFHCRTMELNQACCSNANNCPADQVTPTSCSVGCSLLYPSYVEDCDSMLQDEMPRDVPDLEDFASTCREQDPASVIVFAGALVRQGCTLDLPQASGTPPRVLPPSAPLVSSMENDPWMTSLTRSTPSACVSVRTLMERLDEAERLCCGEDSCADDSFPDTCTPECAVVFHSMLADCGFVLSYALPDELVEPFGQFDQLCLAESTVDVGDFLEAIHGAQCCTPDVCSCPDEDSCNAAREMDDDLESVCVWTEDSGCQDLPCPTSRPVASVSECSVVEGENGGGDDGGQVFTNGRYVYYIGDSGVARTSSTSFTSLDHIRGDVPSDWGKALFADASVGQIYRLCHDCGSAVTGSQVNEGGTATQLQCLDDDLNFQSVVDLSISYTMQNPMVLAVGEGNVAFLDSANHWQLMTLPPGCSAAPEVMDLGVGSGPSEPGSWCESLDRVQVGYLESAIGDNGITFSVLLVGSNDNNKLRRFTLPDGGEEILSFPFCYWSGNTCSLAMDIEKRQFYAHGESQCGLAETVFSCPVEFQQCGNGRRRQLEHALNAEDQDVKTAESFRSVPDTEMSSLGNSSASQGLPTDVTSVSHTTVPTVGRDTSSQLRKLQTSGCRLADLSEHLNDIAEHCCPGNDCSATGYPTADATCSVECGTELEPFWDSCSDMLSLLEMLPDGLSQFYDTCMAVLYPPGQCGDTCNQATFHCRTMEIDQACCSDASNCPEDRATPMSCSVGCSLLYPSFMEDCAGILEDTMESEVVSGLQDFSDTCNEQDPSSVLEYANALVREGCTLDLPQASGDPPPDTLPPSTPLLETNTVWLSNTLDDSCNSIQGLTSRAQEAQRLCCRGNTCAAGELPETCTPECAIAFRGMLADCGFMLNFALPEELVEPYGQFDQLCQAESTLDVGEFLEAIHGAQCCTPDMCACPDEDSCNAAREADDNLESVCHWTDGSVCEDVACSASNCAGCSGSLSACQLTDGCFFTAGGLCAAFDGIEETDQDGVRWGLVMKLSKNEFCYSSSRWTDGNGYNVQYMQDADVPTHQQYDAKSPTFHTALTSSLRLQVDKGNGQPASLLVVNFDGTGTAEELMTTNNVPFATYPDWDTWMPAFGSSRQHSPVFMRAGEILLTSGSTTSCRTYGWLSGCGQPCMFCMQAGDGDYCCPCGPANNQVYNNDVSIGLGHNAAHCGGNNGEDCSSSGDYIGDSSTLVWVALSE
eukprot:COSAG05_NODE_393_length_10383_cov_34.037923_4_plen_2027_part_00